MNIIAQDNAVVNVFLPQVTNTAETAKASEKEQKAKKFKEKIAEMKKKSGKVSKKMKKVNFARGQRMEQCASTIHFYKCPRCGKIEISSMERCRDKMCPLCNWILARQRLNNMVKTFNAIDISKYKFYFLTLTIKNVKPAEINEALQSMAKAWDKMLKRRDSKRYIKGWARSVEITYNQITNTLHPHYHVIIMYEKDCDYLLDGTYFKPVWKETLNIDYDPVIDFRPIRTKNITTEDEKEQNRVYSAVLETFKYSTKSKDLLDMPLETFAQLVNGIGGKRMVSYGGIIRKTRALLNIQDEESEEEETTETKTCECGAEMLETLAEWSMSAAGYTETFTNILYRGEQ